MKLQLYKYYYSVFVLALFFTSCIKEGIPESQKETFIKYFGKTQLTEGIKLYQTDDDHFIFVGNSSSEDGTNKVILAKADAYGNEVWYKTIGDSADNKAYDMHLMSDGGCLILSSTISKTGTTVTSKVWLIRTDRNGNILWEEKIGNEFNITPSCLLWDNNKIIIGGAIQNESTSTDPVSIVCDTLGKNSKIRIFELFDGKNQSTKSICKLDSVYLLMISSNPTASTENFFMGVFNKIDHYLVGEEFGSNGKYVAKKILKLNDGSYVALATYPNGNNGSDFCLINLIYSEDNIIGSSPKFFGTTNNEEATDLIITQSGYALSGFTNNSDGSTDIFYVSTDTQENEIERKTLGGQANQKAITLCQTKDGGIVLLGSNEYSGAGIALMIKIK